MSRFYLSLNNAPEVVIEITTDIADFWKPIFTEYFGVPFLASEEVAGETLRYKFIANEIDAEVLLQRMKEYYESKIVKGVTIDINMN